MVRLHNRIEPGLPRKAYLARRRRKRSRNTDLKPDFKLRRKARPTGCENYLFELRIKRVSQWVDFASGEESKNYHRLRDLVVFVKQVIGGRYKIVQHKKQRGHAIYTTILLDRPVGVILLKMAFQGMVTKVYQYYDPLPESS